jgi:alcohol dehydrogenase (cytochrome c)
MGHTNGIIYLTAIDNVWALDARSNKGYWSTAAPIVVGSHVIVGIGGDSDNIQGFLKSMDAHTGALQWRWDSTPPGGTPKATTGGMTWIPGTYDPELNLLYWGTGNPTPVLNGDVRPGDDLFTCSIVALNWTQAQRCLPGPSLRVEVQP